MKVSNQGMTPYQVAALRIFSAGLVFMPFAIVHLSKVDRKTVALLVIAGFFGNLLPAFCFAIALLKIDSSLTGILNSLTPLCVVMTGIVVFKDKIKLQKSGLSEDAAKDAETSVQQVTDKYITQIEKHLVTKEKEIMVV